MLSHKPISKFINFCTSSSFDLERDRVKMKQFVGCKVLTSDIIANSWGLLLAESAASKLVCLKSRFTGCPVAFWEGEGGKK